MAIGTSLPELMVSVTASRRGQAEMAIGNVLGSNIFNSLGVMGVPALVGTLAIPDSILTMSLPMMLMVTLHNFEDRMQYDSSIAERTAPNAIEQEEAQRVVAVLELDVYIDLLLLPDLVRIRSRSYHELEAHRPRLNEDPRFEVARRVTEDLIRNARSMACKGNAKKLAAEIDDARAAAR